MNIELTISDKIIHLKNIALFQELDVRELTAVASVTEEQESAAGDIIFKEGDLGETLYLLTEGEVAIIKGYDSEHPVKIDRQTNDSYFGEMALFDDDRRSATIQAEIHSRFLTLHKQEFREIIREYPQIAMHASRVLSARLREFTEKLVACNF